MKILIILLAIVPGLLISYLIYRQDRKDKEPNVVLVICFLLGVLSTFPAIWIESKANEYGLEDSMTFWTLLFVAFVVVALLEELVKFLCLLFYAFPKKAFGEPLDGIVYAVMIAMGFATFENIIYAHRYGLETTLFRAFTAVPAHAVFAVFTGYFAGLAKFDPKRRKGWLLQGLGLAVLAHGLYDFFILQEYAEWIMSFATLILFAGIFLAIRMIKAHKNYTPPDINQPTEALTELSAAASEENQVTDAIIEEMEKFSVPANDESE